MNRTDRRRTRLALARAAARGVTLVEVLIVVAIMAMIATGVTVAVIPKFIESQNKSADMNAREVRLAAARWRAVRSDQCPSVAQLVADKEIDSASKTEDPWGSPYEITCGDDEIFVSSPGRDKKKGTPDDINVPAKH